MDGPVSELGAAKGVHLAAPPGYGSHTQKEKINGQPIEKSNKFSRWRTAPANQSAPAKSPSSTSSGSHTCSSSIQMPQLGIASAKVVISFLSCDTFSAALSFFRCFAVERFSESVEIGRIHRIYSIY